MFFTRRFFHTDRKTTATTVRQETVTVALGGGGAWQIALKRFRRHKVGLAGAITVLAIIGIALAAPVIAPFPFDRQDFVNRLLPPSFAHLFGTDTLGRDIFSRIIYGARISLFIGLAITLMEMLIGISLGLASGYFGGLVDLVSTKVTEVLWAFPTIVLALAIVAAIGPGLWNVVIALGVLEWVPFAKVTRTEVQSLKERFFVKAAKMIGENDRRIILRHIFPNVLASIIVLTTLAIPDAVLTSAALSFLGLGVQPPTPEWGAMLSEGRLYMKLAPWISIFPGIALMILVLGFNFMGDALRDALDPLMRGR